MNDLRYTLVAEGSSDRALLPILTWLLRENGVVRAINPAWADLRYLSSPPKTLEKRIATAIELYPCDLLFVHRDADRMTYQQRKDEILYTLAHPAGNLPAVCVVPVRMQETWLLISEDAIRHAASNPRGQHKLQLPSLSRLESDADPKTRLHDLLKQASGLKGRRLKSFDVRSAVQRIPDYINDFSLLRRLDAFRALEQDLRTLLDQEGWR